MVAVYPRLILLMAAAGALVLVFSLGFDPRRLRGKALRCTVLGLGALLLWNALPLARLAVNPLSVLAAGALGLPGLGLLAVLARLP